MEKHGLVVGDSYSPGERMELRVCFGEKWGVKVGGRGQEDRTYGDSAEVRATFHREIKRVCGVEVLP